MSLALTERDWQRLKRAVLLLSPTLFLLACATPALDLYTTTGPTSQNIWWGWSILLLGWLTFFVGHVAWFANPFLAAGLLLLWRRHWKSAIVTTLIALLLTADTLRLNSAPVPSDESGSSNFVLHQALIGCYLWVASIILAAAGAIALWLHYRAQPATPPIGNGAIPESRDPQAT